jgi:hypothetical protein
MRVLVYDGCESGGAANGVPAGASISSKTVAPDLIAEALACVSTHERAKCPYDAPAAGTVMRPGRIPCRP